MALISPSRGQTIVHTHITQFSNLIGGVSGAGEDVRFTQKTNASDYANVFGNVDTTNGYAAKFQYGPANSPTTLMTVSKATGVAISQDNASVYALSVTQQNATNLIQKWVDSNGASPFIMTNTGLFSSSQAGGGAGIAMGNALGGHRLNILTYFDSTGATATGANSFKNVESILNSKHVHASADHSSASIWIIQDTSPGDAAGRALETHADRNTGTAKAWWSQEVGIASTVVTSANTQTDINVGIYLHASTTRFAGNVGAPIPQDAGLVITGDDGFRDYVRFRTRAADFNGTVAFRVAGGYMTLGGVADQDGDVVSIGRWRGGNGTNSLPSVTFGSDPDTGMYWQAADTLAFTLGGTERLRINSTGIIDFRGGANINKALGGGAAPTLGTIGGSGPTTAAQNSWLLVHLSGNPFFIPVWI